MAKINNNYKYESTINRTGGFPTSKSGNVHTNKTTRGGTLKVEWKGGFFKWVPLVDLKQSNTVQFVEYTAYNQFARRACV